MVRLKSGGGPPVRDRGYRRQKNGGSGWPRCPVLGAISFASTLSEKPLGESCMGDREQNDRHEHEPGKPIDDLPHLRSPSSTRECLLFISEPSGETTFSH